jgi:hypothetical protein
MRLFFAICALKNYTILGDDANQAYAQSPPPYNHTFICIDPQYMKWYEKKYGTVLDRELVLPVMCVDAWAEKVVTIMEDMVFI